MCYYIDETNTPMSPDNQDSDHLNSNSEHIVIPDEAKESKDKEPQHTEEEHVEHRAVDVEVMEMVKHVY